jgi:hypothetical protein
MWLVDPLLGNDREISSYTTAVTGQQPVSGNRGMVFSVLSVLRCYNQDGWGNEFSCVVLTNGQLRDHRS